MHSHTPVLKKKVVAPQPVLKTKAPTPKKKKETRKIIGYQKVVVYDFNMWFPNGIAPSDNAPRVVHHKDKGYHTLYYPIFAPKEPEIKNSLNMRKIDEERREIFERPDLIKGL